MKEKIFKIIGIIVMSSILFINMIPLIWLVRTAFVPSENAIDLFKASPITIKNFQYVFSNAPFFQYYVNTMIVILGIFSVQIFFVTLAAYAFARLKFWGQNILFLLFLVQILIAPDVLIIPNYRFISVLNLVDNRLAIMLPYLASAFGIFLLRQNFKQIPIELEEAAKVEGIGTWSLIWKIYAPLSKPAYIAFGIVSISYHWNNFLWPLVVTDSIGKRTLSLGLALFAQSYETGAQWGAVTAATVAVIAPLLIMFFIYEKQIVDSFVHSGIK